MKWPVALVGESLVKTSVGRANQILASEIGDKGRFPVIDQGRAFIAGYTDESERVVTDGIPVVIFGDHTRCVKYVDFPFVLGADGTKVLKPDPELFDEHFFYYALRAIKLPDRGYNRHFSLLREREIPRPALDEQRRVAGFLAVVERGYQQEARLVDLTLELKGTVQRDLFPRSAELADVESRGWALSRIGALGEVVTGTTPKTSTREYYEPAEIPFIAPADLGSTRDIYSPERRISSSGLAVSRLLPAGAVMCVCIGSSIGKVGMTVAPESATNQQINSIICSSNHDSRFVYYLLLHLSSYWRGFATFGTVPILNKGAFSAIDVPLPKSKEEESSIAETLAAIDAKAEAHARRAALLEELFGSALNGLMTGELTTPEVPELRTKVTSQASG